ncbi:hypothetical protein GPALN_006159 [Globodera pallida]|uniref:Uncharacterized protein n=1 Tax=Globodera pallida TaxID=36090 RepID=A0A183BPZ6_GLOPA|nr:hypothetical protein GPALN_006159 [Globodera pallida]
METTEHRTPRRRAGPKSARRLYVKAVFCGYKRGHRKRHVNTSLFLEGVNGKSLFGALILAALFVDCAATDPIPVQTFAAYAIQIWCIAVVVGFATFLCILYRKIRGIRKALLPT